MHPVNLQSAYDYMDSRTDDVEIGATVALYIGYMDFAEDRAGNDRLLSDTPLDMDLLLRAAVNAFHDDPIEATDDSPSSTSRIINREPAERLLETVSEERVGHRSRRFMDAAYMLSNDSPCHQDLLFLLTLFLKTIRRCTPERIESGEFGRHSRRLDDPNNW